MRRTDDKFTKEDISAMISEWLPPNAKSETQYGLCTNLEWCALEKERIGNCEVVYSNIMRRVCLKWNESELARRNGENI